MLSIFKRFKQRLRDMRYLKDLGQAAEDIAHQRDEAPAGAEHYVLSAIRMPDGQATSILAQLGIDADQLEVELSQQYTNALESIGISVDQLEPPNEGVKNSGKTDSPVTPVSFKSRPSTSSLYKKMKSIHDEYPHAPFSGAIVLAGAASLEIGTVDRLFAAMKIDKHQLLGEARKRIANS